MDRKTLEQNYQKSFGSSPAAELEQNYQRSGIDSLVQSVKKATQYNPSAPSTQPTQAAPAGASSRKQSDTMKDQLDAIKEQRDDAAIKAGAYMRAGNMQQRAKEQQKIANKAAIEYENAYTQWKNQRNAEAVEDYNPDENKLKARDAALAGVQNAFQSMRQYAAAASSYLSGNPEAQAWEAKALMEKGVDATEAVKQAGLTDKREIPITDYKTQAELRHEKNVASVGAVEGGALQLVNTISNMVPSLVANAILPGSGLPMMAASAAGNKYADAYEKYGNTDTAFVLGSAAGGASMLTEQFGGLYGSLGKTAAGQAVAKKLMAEAPGLYSLANSVGGKWLRDALSEGIEEGAEDVINYAIEKALTGDSDEMDNFGYDILLGALAGGVLGGGNAAMRSVTYSRVGKALNASPAAVAQQVQEGMEKGAGTAPAIYAAEVQKNPSSQMVGRLYEANLTYDAESGLSKIQNDITQVSINEIKAMVSKADALAQAAQKLNVEATPQAVATAITDAQRTQSIKTAEDSVGQAFAPTVDSPANAGEKAYNSALAGVAADQGVAARINNDPAARQAFSQLTGVQFSGNTAQDIAAIEVATQNLAKSGKQAISQAEYAQRVAAAGEQAAAQFDADMQAQAEQMQRESDERWLSVEQNTITDVDGKRRIKEITNTDVRGNTEIGYKKAEILGSKKKAVAEVNNAAKYLGKTIVWFEGAVQVNGQYRLTNGYRAPDGTIYVNINSRDPLMVTFGHEMFHDLVADSKYSGLIDTLVENPDYADMVKGMMNAKTELYERNGIELDPNAAAEEVAADISGDLLDSRDMLEYIGARNTEAATGIKGFLNRILKKLKGKPSAQEAYNRLSEAQRALIDGMEDGARNIFADPAIGEDVKYSIREEAPPEKTILGYKVFVVKDGKLYPPMVANPNAEDTPVGVWLNADIGERAPDSKTGRMQVKTGGKGTQGGSGSLAFRPGWHLGEVPVASQFDRLNPETGKKELFPSNFVWAECLVAADIDYQEEAMSYGYTKSGKFQHSLAGLPELPVDGYYKYRTNPRPDTVPWLITGAMKVNRILSDSDVAQILESKGITPPKRQGGEKTLEQLGLGKYAGGKFSLIGVSNDGLEIYETSLATQQLSESQKKKQYLALIKNQYRGRTARLERNGHVVYVRPDIQEAGKPIYGDRRSTANGAKALRNSLAEGDVFDLLENAEYDRSSRDTKNHKNADYFDYYVKTVQIDGKVYDLVADVKRAYGNSDGLYYTLYLVDNATKKAVVSQRPQTLGSSEPITASEMGSNSFSADMVPQSDAAVNNYSMQNSAEDALLDSSKVKIVGNGDVDIALPEGYEDIGIAVTGEGSAAPNRYSLMSFSESELGTDKVKYATRLAKATGVSVQLATDWINSVYSVAAIIGDDKARLDYEANRNNTSLKPNSEYDFSLDFSTLCAKRLLFSGTMDAIQSALPNTPLTSEDFVHLREIMKDSGYEVACGICYVESTRREFSTISEGFVERYRKAQAKGTNIKKVNASGQTKDLTTSKGIENSDPNRFVYPEKGFTPTLADLVTAEGIDRLQAEHPEVYKAFNAYMNARGQQKPKMIETRTDYRGEILNMTKGQVSRRNSHGGLRIQSFSDFEVPHLIDMMQAVYDMASMGLKGQAYTKVPSFARAMGRTGIKINLSLIAKGDGVDANGKLIFDDVEGMPASEAFSIRNDPHFSENVGTILVGKNVKHIVTAMADPEIDFIIPFHKSSWSASLYKSLGLEGYEDFTDYQNEKKAGTKIENYDPAEYWDFSKTGDENAQIYLEKCRADGRTPKFAEVMYEGKSLTEYPGYWKLLIDYKMYNNDGVGAPQQAVKPVFDDAYNSKMLSEYKGGHGKLPVAHDIVDRFLKEKSEGSYSLMDTDSTGRKLSAEQKKFFAGSKVVDGNGNLLVMYHGTTAFGYITEFKRGKKGWLGPGIYLTSKRSDAQRYADAMGEGNGRLYEMYANITKPLVVTDGNPVPGILKAAYGKDSVYKSRSEKQANDPSIVTQADINKLRAKGYDGIVWDFGGSKEVSVFSPEQVKLADNVDPTSSKDIRYSLMEDAQYMADIDKAVADAAQKANDELKAAQAEVKNLRQQLADYRQQATAEAKMNDRWRDAETKLLTEIAAAKEREKAAKARAEFMAKYDALSKQYRADLRANNQQAQEKYNEKLTEAKDEFNRRRTQDRIDRVVREDRAKSKARLRTAEQKSTTTEDVAKVLTEMPKKDKETFKAKAAKDWRTFKRQWINTKDELERFGNEVGDSRIMYAANNVGQASAAAQYSIGGAGQYDLNGKKIGDKNLMQVFEPAKKAGLTDEFYTYLLHEHNVDRMSVRENAQRQLAELRAKLNREVNGFSEMTDENIATAAGKDTTLTKAYTEAQIAAAKQYKQFQAWAEKQFDKPVFGSSVTADDSRAAAAALLEAHPEFEKWAKDVYAYLDGLMEVRKQGGLVSADMAQYMKELYPHYVPTYRDMPSTSGGYSNPNSVAVNSTIKSAKGGNQDIMPLIDSIARQTLQTFSAAKKNILGNMLYEDAMDTTRDISEYIQSVTEEGDLVDLDADSAENLKNTLRIWVDGKPVTLHMSEAMADGFRPIEQSNSFGMKALRSINSTFKKLVTQWNPVFIVRNFVRDAQSALYFTHYSNATFIKNYGKAVKEIATNGKYWQLYQAMGGKGTTYYDPKTGLSDHHHFKNGAVDKVAGGLNRVIDILSFANEAVEQYPRLAEFISTMEDTGDVQQALYNAADITTNFGRGGFAARKLNASLVPFFNPGMQGLSKNIRNVIDRRGWKEIGQLISRLLINGVAPGIIMGLLYDGLKEDDDYKELSNYIKDSNILIKIGDNKFIKVPMGREPSVITAFTNRMWRWLKGEPASSAFAGYPSFAIEQIAPNNPLTNNIFAGITAMSTNKTWYGGDIVSSYMEEKPDYLQYDESTDAFSIWLGEITRHGKNGIEGLSPKKVNYLIDQYSGFIGDWLLPALSKKADVPAVVKAFVVDSVRQNRLGSDFYDALDEAKQVKETEFATAADDATFSYLYKQSKAASEITKQLKEIYNSGEKTRKEKMSEARDLLELRNEIYRKALLTVGTYEETAKSIGSADSDVVKREANRKAFGAEYALKNYNKDVGEKAAEYVAHGVTYDQYYAAYFAARGITGDKDENGKTITNSASRKKKDAIDKAVPNATTKQKHLLYEAIGVSEKVW